MNDFPYEIRSACQDDWDLAIELAWKTFLKYEGKDYSREGIQSFQEFLSDTVLYRMFSNGDYPMFVACDDDRLIGMITLRSMCHVSLLFVDEDYHRRGVGRSLMKELVEFVQKELNGWRVTVNSSPYGIGFYHKVGFKDVGPEMEKSGIRYTPMEFLLK